LYIIGSVSTSSSSVCRNGSRNNKKERKKRKRLMRKSRRRRFVGGSSKSQPAADTHRDCLLYIFLYSISRPFIELDTSIPSRVWKKLKIVKRVFLVFDFIFINRLEKWKKGTRDDSRSSIVSLCLCQSKENADKLNLEKLGGNFEFFFPGLFGE
jgi:hypothetical protein